MCPSSATILGLACVALAASLANAQVTFVSQARSVRANGCTPPVNNGQSATNYDPFNASAFLSCPSGPTGFGTASQNSTISPTSITLQHQANNIGNAGAESQFEVVFDVATPTAYTLGALSEHPNAFIRFTGPSVNVNFTNNTTSESGLLQPGRYTLASNAVGIPGTLVRANLTLTLSPPPFATPWFTQDCGGGVLTAGGFKLWGTIAQHDASLPVLSGGEFRITSGYWAREMGEPPCPADLDDDGSFANGAHPDGGVTVEDLLFFLSAFEQGDPEADLDNDGDDPQLPDGAVTVEDLIYLLRHFELGC